MDWLCEGAIQWAAIFVSLFNMADVLLSTYDGNFSAVQCLTFNASIFVVESLV